MTSYVCSGSSNHHIQFHLEDIPETFPISIVRRINNGNQKLACTHISYCITLRTYLPVVDYLTDLRFPLDDEIEVYKLFSVIPADPIRKFDPTEL